MAKKRIFISFDYDKDKHYKNLLTAWDKNNLFDFAFYDGSVTVPVNSSQAGPIRRVISQRISDCTRVICIVGEETHKSDWVTWELEKAKEKGKKLVAVKTAKGNTTPAALYGAGATWALSFTFESIKKAIEDS